MKAYLSYSQVRLGWRFQDFGDIFRASSFFKNVDVMEILLKHNP